MKWTASILCILFNMILLYDSGYGQSSYLNIYGTQNDDYTSNALCINNNCYFIRDTYIHSSFWQVVESRLVKVSNQNSVEESQKLNVEGYRLFGFTNLVEHKNLIYSLPSALKQTTDGTWTKFFTVVDTNLNLLLQKQIELPYITYSPIFEITFFIDNSIMYVYQDVDFVIYIMKFDLLGNIILNKQLYSEQKPHLTSVTHDKLTGGYYLLLTGRWTQEYAESTLLKVDSVFNYEGHSIRKQHLEYCIGYRSTMKQIDTNKLIVQSCGSRLWGNGTVNWWNTEESGILLIDTNYNTIDSLYPDTHHMESDTLSDTPQRYGIDFLDTNDIYCIHEINFDCSYELFPTCYNYYKVYKIDAALNIKWLYICGGDASYLILSITATDDGGCFVLGERYDYQTQNEENDIFYIKTDSTGLILHKSDNAPAMHNAAVFPNPGNDYFEVQSGPQIFGATFELFDLNGRLVKQEIISSQTTTISTTNLATGTYVWRVLYKNKEVESGKWIKSL